MFCFSRRQQNNFWYKKKNYGTGLKKNGFSTHFRLLGVVDWATTYSLPLHYICLGCPLGCFPRHHIFCKTSKLSYYFYIVNKYVRYNNVYYPLVVPFDIFCQQEVNQIYNQVPKAQQVTCGKGTRKSYPLFLSVTVNNKNVSNQCNLTVEIEQVVDKNSHRPLSTKHCNCILLILEYLFHIKND